ncbi:MAG: hypothetical protein Q4D02_04820 [Clostridia bacterium]|nr:hypothetical protein [Clostridia bacterium]
MREELEFLEYLYNIVKLEKDALSRMIKMRDKNDLLNNILKEQIGIYKRFGISIEKMIENRKKKVEDLSIFAKMASHVGAKFVTSKDNDIDRIFNILMQRYQVCIEEVNSKVQENKITSKTILNLTNRFIEFQNRNINTLNKAYKLFDKS